jgi:hypothetical protein
MSEQPADMPHRADETMSTESLAAMKTLEMLLDYAIVEGAERKMPDFVYLLRMAREELVQATLNQGVAEELVDISGPTANAPDIKK